MATTLGKRKRKTVETLNNVKGGRKDPAGSYDEDAQEIFRRHFEAQFKPLPMVKKVVKVVEELTEIQLDDESEWGGISEEDEDSVQVIEHTDAEMQMASMSKEQLKSFMVLPSQKSLEKMLMQRQSSKPPSSGPSLAVIRDKGGAAIEDDDASEAANLKKDLALQRLLTESHLLESATNPTLRGNNRHKATDLRLQALGSKVSILKQEKMPLAHRRGIIAKQSEKEDKRRKEARDNGIILEKAKMGKKPIEGKRDRGVGAPGIGKFSGGTLKLSKKDILSVEGPKGSSSSRGGRGGARGRGKRGK
jgi:hypothetical protein